MLRSTFLFLVAGLMEIGGGYLVWLWMRERGPLAFGISGLLILALYGFVPTFQPTEHPFGRVYAAYGAVFIILSVLWGWKVDHQMPDLRDVIGVVLSLIGAVIMMLPRTSGAAH